MIKGPKTDGELEKVLCMQATFPNLANGFSNGLSYRQIADKIRGYQDKQHPFSQMSTHTVSRYVAWSLRGFKFNGAYYKGLQEDDIEQMMIQKQQLVAKNNLVKTGMEHWSSEEKGFVKEQYMKGIPPKEILRAYEQQRGFTQRTHAAVDCLICSMRRRGEITQHQRINWDSDIGFSALALVGMYGKDKNYAHHVRRELNDFYFNGEERITKVIFHNFLKRNSQELEKILEENDGFRR